MAFPPASPIVTGVLAETCLSGCWQMAIDGALLQRQQPVLRLYRWSRPTLSLGFHQAALHPSWIQWQRQGRLDLVRRPTGGGAVLHGGDLCYAVVLPCGRFERQQAYGWICGWLQEAFAALGEPLQLGRELADRNPNCFARSTSADLVTVDGQKRIGNAQRWQHGWLLQHGSIQLQTDAQAWQVLLGSPPPRLGSLGVSSSDLGRALLQALPEGLQLAGRAAGLEAPLLAAAGGQLERYRLPGGSGAVTSPLASIARTT